MIKRFSLGIKPAFFEEAWDFLEAKGIVILYGSGDEERAELFIEMDEKNPLPLADWLLDCQPWSLPEIDWEAQWALHGHDYHEGLVHLELSFYFPGTPPLLLEPGPGFGDFSHPTTRLSLEYLAKYLTDQLVIDVGSGSGILSIAAALMGAPTVMGLDIDPMALEHARNNARRNGVDSLCSFAHASDFILKEEEGSLLVLMNMIQSEQEVAKLSLSCLEKRPALFITSGIRSDSRALYLLKTESWGWKLLEEKESEGWSAFVFLKPNHSKIMLDH